jgi:hypothetical protein
MPMLYLFAGFGFDYLWNVDPRRVVALAFVVVVGLAAVSPIAVYFRSHPENIRPVVTALDSAYAPGDRIYVYYGANPAFRYYYRAKSGQTIFGLESREQPGNYFRQLDQALVERGALWLVFSHCYNDECNQIVDYVARSRETEKIVGDADVALYRVSGQ